MITFNFLTFGFELEEDLLHIRIQCVQGGVIVIFEYNLCKQITNVPENKWERERERERE